MPVITITGLMGSGGTEVGSEVAKRLGIDFVDRAILAEAAKKLGTTVAVVADRTEKPPSLGDRVAGFARTVLERSALAGGGADPYFGGGLDALLVREYREFPDDSTTGTEEMANTDELLRVTAEVIKEISASGNVIIAGRGANFILANQPEVLHIGLTSALEQRIERIMDRVSLERPEAEKYVSDNDKGRNAFFRRYFNVQAEDVRHYHMVLNTDWMHTSQAADMVIAAVEIIRKK